MNVPQHPQAGTVAPDGSIVDSGGDFIAAGNAVIWRDQLAKAQAAGWEIVAVKTSCAVVHRSRVPPDWKALGYTSEAEQREDMEAIGRSFMEAYARLLALPMFTGWAPSDDPVEIVDHICALIAEGRLIGAEVDASETS